MYLQGDEIFEHKRKEKLQKYDKFFKKFNYSKALDEAVSISQKGIKKSKNICISVNPAAHTFY